MAGRGRKSDTADMGGSFAKLFELLGAMLAEMRAAREQERQWQEKIVERLVAVETMMADSSARNATAPMSSAAAGDRILPAVPAASPQVIPTQVVIMGVNEQTSLPARERRSADEETVLTILDTLEVDAVPLNVYRMGTYDEARWRPIKVAFDNPHDVVQLLRRCRLLKTAGGPFEKVYVRPSHSHELRVKLREAREVDKTAVIYRGEVMSRSAIPKKGGAGGRVGVRDDRDEMPRLSRSPTRVPQAPTRFSPSPAE